MSDPPPPGELEGERCRRSRKVTFYPIPEHAQQERPAPIPLPSEKLRASSADHCTAPA